MKGFEVFRSILPISGSLVICYSPSVINTLRGRVCNLLSYMLFPETGTFYIPETSKKSYEHHRLKRHFIPSFLVILNFWSSAKGNPFTSFQRGQLWRELWKSWQGNSSEPSSLWSDNDGAISTDIIVCVFQHSLSCQTFLYDPLELSLLNIFIRCTTRGNPPSHGMLARSQESYGRISWTF